MYCIARKNHESGKFEININNEGRIETLNDDDALDLFKLDVGLCGRENIKLLQIAQTEINIEVILPEN